MGRSLTRQLTARVEAIEAARGMNEWAFRTAAGRVFKLDTFDVLSVCLDALAWLHDPMAEQPRGRVLEALASAEPDKELGMLGCTAVQAARMVLEGERL